MARGFNLTAQLNLRGPSNIKTVVADIRRELGTIDANINLKFDPKVTGNISSLNSALKSLNSTLTASTSALNTTSAAMRNFGNSVNISNIKNFPQQVNNATSAVTKLGSSSSSASKDISVATNQMQEFGNQSALAIRRFAAFTAVTTIIFGVTNAIGKGLQEIISFDKEMVTLQQITGESRAGLKGLSDNITLLATSLGVSSHELVDISSTLAQAGLSAKETEQAIKALALSSLAPSFSNMNDTVEGSIALMRQFNISAVQLEGALGSINSVAARFAVEASDIITAIQRTGGVFATASQGVSEGTDALNEFIAVFTSVRATTRESAETIATGLRTIFTRIQRGDTIDALKAYGVNLQDLDGKFVGAYKAVELLSRGLSGLDPRDVSFSKIIEELGGFRQIGKVIPLIQQFSVAQAALKVAQEGQGSLAKDATTAQLSLGNQMAKVREQFLALAKDIGSSVTFQTMIKGAIGLAGALVSVGNSIKGILPSLAILLAFKGAGAIAGFASGFFGGRGATKKQDGGRIMKFARGGFVPGTGDGDTVPAMLEPGEFVIRKKAVETLGAGNLHRMNKSGGGSVGRYANGGTVQKFAIGGPIGNIKKLGPGKGNEGKIDSALTDKIQLKDIVRTDIKRKLITATDLGTNLDIFKQDIDTRVSTDRAKAGKDSKLKKRYYSDEGKSFENYLYDNNIKKIKDNYILSTSQTYPMDLIPRSTKAPAEIKYKNESEPDALILNKRLRYSVATGELKTKRGFTIKEPPDGPIDLGDTILFELPTGLKDNIYSPNKAMTTYVKEQRDKRRSSTQKRINKASLSEYRGGGEIQKFGKGSVYPVAAIETYQNTSRDINAHLTNQDIKEEDKEHRKYLNPTKLTNIEDTIKKLDSSPKTKTPDNLYTGIGENRLDIIKQKIGNKLQSQKDIMGASGSTFALPGFLSSSKSQKVGMNFSQRGFLNIKTKKGATGIDVNAALPEKMLAEPHKQKIQEMLREEQEIILPRSTPLKILKVSASYNSANMSTPVPWTDPSYDTRHDPFYSMDIQQLGIGGVAKAKMVEAKIPLRDMYRRLVNEGRLDGTGITDKDFVSRVPNKHDDLMNRLVIDSFAAETALAQKAIKGSELFGLVGLIGKTKHTSLGPEMINGKSIYTKIGMLSEKTSARLQKEMAGGNASSTKNLAESMQAEQFLGSGGNLAIDFDETLVSGADILNDKGLPDIEKYFDMKAVAEALQNAKLKSPIGTHLKEVLAGDPKFIEKIRVLSARPQTSAALIAATLNRLGIPIGADRVTGVSSPGMTSEGVATAKAKNLGYDEALIDDNLQNILAARKANKTAHHLTPVAELSEEELAITGKAEMEGYTVQQILTRLGAPAATRGAMSMDFPKGLGPVAQFFGIEDNIPTDVKRTIDSTSIGKYRAEVLSFLENRDGALGAKDSKTTKISGGTGAKASVKDAVSVAKRNVGYIDSDVLANPANARIVGTEMAKLGISKIVDYKRYLSKLAATARRDGSLDRLSAITGVAGSGKSSLMLGGSKSSKADNASLRLTTRNPILTAEDIASVSQVIDVTATVSPERLSEHLTSADKVYSLSSSTKEEREEIKRRRDSRDVTGNNLFGRSAGVTAGAPTDSGSIEGMLASEIDKKKLRTLGITSAGFKRKMGPTAETKKIAAIKGGFAPTTRGHQSIRDAAQAMGFSIEDFVVLVGSNEGITGKDPDAHAFRTVNFDQDFRTILAKAAFSKSIVNKADPGFGMPDIFEGNPGESGRRHFVRPGPGSVYMASGKTEDQLQKYKDKGYTIGEMKKRTTVEGSNQEISGTATRAAILSGDITAMRKFLSPAVFDIVQKNLTQLQNREKVLPEIMAGVKSRKDLSLASIDKELATLPSRIDRKKMDIDPAYKIIGDQVDALRAHKKKVESQASFEPFALMRKLAEEFPEKYGLSLTGGKASLGDTVNLQQSVQAKSPSITPGITSTAKPIKRGIGGGIPKLGKEVYDLQKATGLSNFEFDKAKKFGDTMGYGIPEFKTYLAKIIEQKKSKAGMKIDSKALAESLKVPGKTSTSAQLALAAKLKGPSDAAYTPRPSIAEDMASVNRITTGYAAGGAAEAKKIKQDEKIALTIKRGRVSAKYMDNANASGEVVADRLQELGSAPLFSVQSSSATKGYGPKLYDAVMEGVTESGNQLVSDRHSVSPSAYNVWKYYFKNRGDVKKTPLAPENWYHGSKWFDKTKFPSEDPKTWAPHSDEAWVLQTGYTKSPSDIKNPNLVQRFAIGGAASDTVPALLTPGEFVINKKAAESIGYGQLRRMNHADKIQGFAKGGSVGRKGNLAEKIVEQSGFAGPVSDDNKKLLNKNKKTQDLDKILQIDPSTISQITKFQKAMNDAGVTGGEMAKLINAGGKVSIRATKEAMQADIEAARASGATISQLGKAATALTQVGAAGDEAARHLEGQRPKRGAAIGKYISDSPTGKYIAPGLGKIGTGLQGNAGFMLAAGLGIATQYGEGFLGKKDSSKAAASRNATFESGVGIASAGIGLASQVAMIPLVGPALAGVVAIGTAATVAADYFYDFTGSQKAAIEAFEQQTRDKKISESSGKLADTFDKLQKDVNNIDLQRLNVKQMNEAQSDLTENTDQQVIAASKKTKRSIWGAMLSSDTSIEDAKQFLIDKKQIAKDTAGKDETQKAAQSARFEINRRLQKGDNLENISKDENLGKILAAADAEISQQIIDKRDDIRSDPGNAKKRANREAEIAQLVKQAVLNDGISKANVTTNAMERAHKAAALAGQKLSDSFESMSNKLNQALNKTTLELDDMSEADQRYIDGLAGKSKLPSFKSESLRTLNNPTSYTREQVERANYTAANMLGGGQASQTVASIANLGNSLNTSTSTALKNAAKGGGIDLKEGIRIAKAEGIKEIKNSGSTAENQELLIAQLENELDAIAKKLEGGAEGDAAGLGQGRVKLQELMAEVQRSTKSVGDGAGKLFSELNKAILAFREKVFNKFTDSVSAASERLEAAFNYQLKAFEIISSAKRAVKEISTGRKETSDERKSRLNQETSTLTGGITDPFAIQRQIEGLNNKKKKQEEQLKITRDRAEATSGALAIGSEATPKQRAEANDNNNAMIRETIQLNQTNRELDRTQKALENLANSADVLNVALEELRNIKALETASIDYTKKLLSSTPEDAKKLQESFARLQNNMNGVSNSARNSSAAQKAFADEFKSSGNIQKANKAGQTVLAQERGFDIQNFQENKGRIELDLKNRQAQVIFADRKANNRGKNDKLDADAAARANLTDANIDQHLRNLEANIYEQMGRETGIDTSETVNRLRDPNGGGGAAARLAEEKVNAAAEIQKNANIALGNLNLTMADLTPAIIALTNSINLLQGNAVNVEELKIPAAAVPRSLGGMIYASVGKLINFEPKGTDTVPAMLTPGEFVVNRAATQANLPLLQSINKAKGGVAYLKDGGQPTQQNVKTYLKHTQGDQYREHVKNKDYRAAAEMANQAQVDKRRMHRELGVAPEDKSGADRYETEAHIISDKVKKTKNWDKLTIRQKGKIIDRTIDSHAKDPGAKYKFDSNKISDLVLEENDLSSKGSRRRKEETIQYHEANIKAKAEYAEKKEKVRLTIRDSRMDEYKQAKKDKNFIRAAEISEEVSKEQRLRTGQDLNKGRDENKEGTSRNLRGVDWENLESPKAKAIAIEKAVNKTLGPLPKNATLKDIEHRNKEYFRVKDILFEEHKLTSKGMRDRRQARIEKQAEILQQKDWEKMEKDSPPMKFDNENPLDNLRGPSATQRKAREDEEEYQRKAQIDTELQKAKVAKGLKLAKKRAEIQKDFTIDEFKKIEKHNKDKEILRRDFQRTQAIGRAKADSEEEIRKQYRPDENSEQRIKELIALGDKRTHEQNIEINARQIHAGVPWDKKTTIAGLHEAEARLVGRDDYVRDMVRAQHYETMVKLKNLREQGNVEDIERTEVAGASGAKAIIPAIAGFGAGTVAAILSGGAAIPTLGGSVAVGAVAVPAAAITASLGANYLQEAVLDYLVPEWNAKQKKKAQEYPVTAFAASALTGTGVNSVASKAPLAQVISGTIAQRVGSGVTEAGVGAGVDLALNRGKFSDNAMLDAFMNFSLGVAAPNKPMSLRPRSRRIPPGSAPDFFPPETIANMENIPKPSNRYTILDNEGRQVANPNYDPGKPQTQENLKKDRTREKAAKEYERVQNKAKNEAEIQAHQKAQVEKFAQDRRTIQDQIDNKDFPAAAENIQALNSSIQSDNEIFFNLYRSPQDRIPLRNPTAEIIYKELLNEAGSDGDITSEQLDAKIDNRKSLHRDDAKANRVLENARNAIFENITFTSDERYTDYKKVQLEKLTARLEKMPRTPNQENMDANRDRADYILGKFRDTLEGVKGGVKQGWNELFSFDPKAQVNPKDPLKNQETLEEAAAIREAIKKGTKNPPAANKPAKAAVKKQPETEDDKKTLAFLEAMEQEQTLSDPASTTAKPKERYLIADEDTDFASKPEQINERYKEVRNFLKSLGHYNYLTEQKDNLELARKLGKLGKDLFDGTQTKKEARDILQKEYDNDPTILLQKETRRQKEDAANEVSLNKRAQEVKDRVDKRYQPQITDAINANNYKEVARLEMKSSLAFHDNLYKQGVPLPLDSRSARSQSSTESLSSNTISEDLKYSKPELFGDKVETTKEIRKAKAKAIREAVYNEYLMRDDTEGSSLTLSEPQSIQDRVYLNLMQYFGLSNAKSKRISDEIIQKRAQYMEQNAKPTPTPEPDFELTIPTETDADRSNRERTESSPGSNSDSNRDTLSRLMKRGTIYASAGRLINFEPKGTDTVPAMLTPGEFVVNRAATQANLPLLQSINKARGGLIYAEYGGVIYAAKGRPVPSSGALIDAKSKVTKGTKNRSFGEDYVDFLLGNIKEGGLQAESFAYGAAKSIIPTFTGAGIQPRARGGVVYASNGALITARSSGSDTVPAMLSEGEFVVNRQSSQKHAPLLQAINSGHYDHGGMVNYLNNGGIATTKYFARGDEVTQNLEKLKENRHNNSGVSNNGGSSGGMSDELASSLEKRFQSFEQSVTSLGEHMTRFETSAGSFGGHSASMSNSVDSFGKYVDNVPSELQISGNLNTSMNVSHNGAEAFSQMGPALENMAIGNINRTMNNLNTGLEGSLFPGDANAIIGKNQV